MGTYSPFPPSPSSYLRYNQRQVSFLSLKKIIVSGISSKRHKPCFDLNVASLHDVMENGEGGNGGYVLFLKKYGDSPNRVIRVSYVPIVRGGNLRERERELGEEL